MPGDVDQGNVAPGFPRIKSGSPPGKRLMVARALLATLRDREIAARRRADGAQRRRRAVRLSEWLGGIAMDRCLLEQYERGEPSLNDHVRA
jgi:hypothetical protein